MARPKKEGMDYFPHDTDSVNDEKVEALRMLYGNDGYAFYFILLERIYRTKNAELDVSDAETMQILSRKVGVTIQEFENMLKTALKRDCFDQNEYEKRGVLTSNGIKKRLAPIIEKRESMRRKYVSNNEKDSCVVSDAETRQKPDKVKESKVKKSKENTNKKQYADFVTLTSEEYKKLLTEHGESKTKRMIEILDNYKGSSGKKYKSDYRTILNWVVERVNEEFKKKTSSKGQVDFDSLRRELEDEQTTGLAYHPNNNHILPKQIQNGRSKGND